MRLIDAEALVAMFWRRWKTRESWICAEDLEEIEELIDTLPIVKLEEKLKHYKSLKTYTDCEEYRREGAIGVLEDILEDLSPNKS